MPAKSRSAKRPNSIDIAVGRNVRIWRMAKGLSQAQLSNRLGHQVYVENRGGANGGLGAIEVMRAEPDGYTVGAISDSPMTVNPWMYEKLAYSPLKDFIAVARINHFPSLLVGHPSVPVKTVADLIALAKQKPGTLNYASSGIGTPYHMAGELFKAMSGTDITHVPHKASGDARNSVIGGHVQMMLDAITTMAPNVAAGQVRGLGTTGARRSTVLPDLPTIAEAGVPSYEAVNWWGIVAPAGTPQPIIDKLHDAIAAVQNSPEVKEQFAREGAEIVQMSPSEFGSFMESEMKKWERVVKEGHIKAE